MRNARRVSACILAIIISTIVASGCFAYEAYQSLSPTIQPISGAVDIGDERVEIVPPEPLKSKQMRQHVQVKVQGVDTWEDDYKTVRYEDGRSGKLEAYLFDDKGQSYELAIYGTGGVGGGVAFSRKRQPRSLDMPPLSEPDYLRDRNYIKLRIRSDIPVQADGIVWVCTTPK